MGFFNRKKLASDAELVDLLRTMHVRMGKLEGEMEKLGAGHQSLRGFVYSKLRKAAEADEEAGVHEGAPTAAPPRTPQAPPTPMSREELRRTLVASGRFIPGKPPRHD